MDRNGWSGRSRMWIDIADQSGQEYGKKIETTDEASNECGSISLIRSITIVDRTRIEMDGRANPECRSMSLIRSSRDVDRM